MSTSDCAAAAAAAAVVAGQWRAIGGRRRIQRQRRNVWRLNGWCGNVPPPRQWRQNGGAEMSCSTLSVQHDL